MSPLAPGSTIGILGGGQLGRMLALAAADDGLRARMEDFQEALAATIAEKDARVAKEFGG